MADPTIVQEIVFEMEAVMAHIEKSIEVEAPLTTVYNQWTQFESFPQFMEGVKEVQQLDEKRLHWRAEIAGKEMEWDAEITQQIPDQRIGWRSVGGAVNAGSLDFRPLSVHRTEITLRLEYDPQGVTENVGDAVGLVSARISGDLKRFKEFIEKRGVETGAWRGEIESGQVTKKRAA